MVPISQLTCLVNFAEILVITITGSNVLLYIHKYCIYVSVYTVLKGITGG